MKVRFLQDITVATDNPPFVVKKGDMRDLNEASANRWLRRGIAELVSADVKPVVEAKKVEVPKVEAPVAPKAEAPTKAPAKLKSPKAKK